VNVEVLRLSPGDCRLLTARFGEHANSHRRMVAALEEAGADAPLARLRALRILERRFSVDLGSLCWRFERVDHPNTHPIERYIVQYVTRVRRTEQGSNELLVLLDNVRQVRELMEGRLVGEPEA
jgi:hypothetical protein